MVTIRLARGGAKKRPFYHLVATDSRKPRDSGHLERLGFFNPIAGDDEERLRIDQERVRFWLDRGAKTSERAAHLIRRHAEAQPAEVQPAKAKPAETKPAKAEAGENKPAEVQPAKAEAGENKPAETKPAEAKPAETKPAEEPPAESKPAEAQPAAD